MNRLVFIIQTCIFLIVFASCSEPSDQLAVRAPNYWPTDGWRTSSPEAQGMDSERLADALDYIHENAIPIHSLQIIRNGYLVLDAYFYPFDANNVHDGASVTKSVTATLIGIAIDQGHIASVGESVVSLFPGRDISNRDAAKEAVTVEDLLTMQPGLEFDAEPGEPTLRQMRQSPDCDS